MDNATVINLYSLVQDFEILITFKPSVFSDPRRSLNALSSRPEKMVHTFCFQYLVFIHRFLFSGSSCIDKF